MRILVVEDDFASRRMMQRLLSAYGDVDVVVDGQEAVDAFRLAWEDAQPYEVIFMDIMMPRVDGQEALKQIRVAEKEIGVAEVDEAQIIMTTVLEDPHNVVTAFHAGGATDYMVKPVDIDGINKMMAKLGHSSKA